MSKYFNYLEIHEGEINQSLSNLNLQDDKYFDPDSSSSELYTDMKTIFQNRSFPNGFYIKKIEVTHSYNNYGLQFLIANQENKIVYLMNMGADYFGISKKWLANRSHFTFNEIKEVLSVSRLIGGHMLFPRNVKNMINDKYIGGLPSVNTARGGRPMFDRTDLFLLDLKNYYESRPFRLKALEKYQCFFDLFINFNNFVDFFDLNNFVDSQYNVINLLTNEPFSDSENLIENEELLSFPENKSLAEKLTRNSCTRILYRTQEVTNKFLNRE